MMSRSDILRIGVQVRLRELEVERRQLLKLVGEPVGKVQTGLEILAAAGEAKGKRRKFSPDRPHWTQTPEGKRRLRKMARAQHRRDAATQ